MTNRSSQTCACIAASLVSGTYQSRHKAKAYCGLRRSPKQFIEQVNDVDIQVVSKDANEDRPPEMFDGPMDSLPGVEECLVENFFHAIILVEGA